MAVGVVSLIASTALFATPLLAGRRAWVERLAVAVLVGMLVVALFIDGLDRRQPFGLVAGAAVLGLFISYLARLVQDARKRSGT